MRAYMESKGSRHDGERVSAKAARIYEGADSQEGPGEERAGGDEFWAGKRMVPLGTDTAARMEGIMADFPNIRTEVIPVKLAPQVM